MLKQILLLSACAILLTFADPQPTTYIYKTVGDHTIKADVFVPTSTLYHKYPVILAVHGGGFMVGTTIHAYSIQERDEMLKRGWVVVAIDYRLNPSVLLPEIVQDVEDAYYWIRNELVKTLPINPNAIAFFGGSAGAGLALMAAYKVTPRPQAVIAFYPFCTDFTASFIYDPSKPVSEDLIKQADGYREPVLSGYIPEPANDPRQGFFFSAFLEKKFGWVITTKNPEEPADNILAILKEYSVLYHVDASFPPTYLVHGKNDSIVPYQQSVDLAEKLKENDIPHKLDIIAETEHSFDLGGVSPDVWKEHMVPVFEWAQQRLGDSCSGSSIEIDAV